jgi:predicted nucleotidyltransferase
MNTPADSAIALAPEALHVLRAQQGLAFAVLVGSRATGRQHVASDWDIALQWDPAIVWMDAVARTERLRRDLAAALGVPESPGGVIGQRTAHQAQRAAVAEEGVPLTGSDGLAWPYFLQRTWRDLEDYYWEQSHAA